jgi:hypothetical protein
MADDTEGQGMESGIQSKFFFFSGGQVRNNVTWHQSPTHQQQQPTPLPVTTRFLYNTDALHAGIVPHIRHIMF